jgi:hypothetical protein
MIEIDETKWFYCDSCNKYFKHAHALHFGADLNHRGLFIYLCDACLSELKEALEKKEVKSDRKNV